MEEPSGARKLSRRKSNTARRRNAKERGEKGATTMGKIRIVMSLMHFSTRDIESHAQAALTRPGGRAKHHKNVHTTVSGPISVTVEAVGIKPS